MIRLFLGFQLNDNLIIQSQQDLLKNLLSQSQIKWVESHNFHITLKFLGNTEDYFVNSISRLLAERAKKHTPFYLQYVKTGYFGSKQKPSIIWCGFKQNPDLLNLQYSIDKDLFQLGFPQDKRTYNPHLTLGRVRKIKEIENFERFFLKEIALKKKRFLVEKFVLFQSKLDSTGSAYSVLREFYLGEPKLNVGSK